MSPVVSCSLNAWTVLNTPKVIYVRQEQKLFYKYKNATLKNDERILYCQSCENSMLTDQRSRVFDLIF